MFHRVAILTLIMLTSIRMISIAAEQIGEHPIELAKLDLRWIPNPIRLHSQVVSGGMPEGDAAFAELAKYGIRTMISVDGMTPDVEAAKRHGLRYVHLPHGYDGVPKERVRELAKAIQELPKPIFIHCHHGKHRSPAAAAAACIAAGYIEANQGLSVLRLAGTNPNYQGLFKSVSEARRESDAELRAMPVQFVESASLTPMAEAMVRIEVHHDRLRQFEKSDWKPIADHPEWMAAHEALLLKEEYVELLRAADILARDSGFLSELQAAQTSAFELEEALRTASLATAQTHSRIKDAYQAVSDRCTNCHQKFRDNPVSLLPK